MNTLKKSLLKKFADTSFKLILHVMNVCKYTTLLKIIEFKENFIIQIL